nr:uncharacterized protein CTRU02_02092 [Colletotrichum truncatum]KAF6799221.1 hypothetical protein CTRU02_02092 [Colletotrichum truncatum]
MVKVLVVFNLNQESFKGPGGSVVGDRRTELELLSSSVDGRGDDVGGGPEGGDFPLEFLDLPEVGVPLDVFFQLLVGLSSVLELLVKVFYCLSVFVDDFLHVFCLGFLFLDYASELIVAFLSKRAISIGVVLKVRHVEVLSVGRLLREALRLVARRG